MIPPSRRAWRDRSCLPAIVHPEPQLRPLGDDLLQSAIHLQGQQFRSAEPVSLLRNGQRRKEAHPVSEGSQAVDSDRDDGDGGQNRKHGGPCGIGTFVSHEGQTYPPQPGDVRKKGNMCALPQEAYELQGGGILGQQTYAAALPIFPEQIRDAAVMELQLSCEPVPPIQSDVFRVQLSFALSSFLLS